MASPTPPPSILLGFATTPLQTSRKQVVSQTPLASKGPAIPDSRVPSWSVSVLALVGVSAAGWALGYRRILSRDAGFRVGMQETQVHRMAMEVPEQLFGHFRAEEAPQSDLKAVLADGSVLLRTAALEAFLRMQGIARQDGVWLIPLSGLKRRFSMMSRQNVVNKLLSEPRSLLLLGTVSIILAML